MQKKQLSIGLKPDQYRQLKRIAKAEEVSIAHVVRRIFKQALVKEEKDCP